MTLIDEDKRERTYSRRLVAKSVFCGSIEESEKEETRDEAAEEDVGRDTPPRETLRCVSLRLFSPGHGGGARSLDIDCGRVEQDRWWQKESDEGTCVDGCRE